MKTRKEIEESLVLKRIADVMADERTVFVLVTALPETDLRFADYSIFRNACVHEALAMVDAAKGFLCEEAHNESRSD